MPLTAGKLVGRDRERSLIQGAWAKVLAGRPQLVVVTGHRRVGKTFLLQRTTAGLPDAPRVYHQATHAAEAPGAALLRGRCRRGAG